MTAKEGLLAIKNTLQSFFADATQPDPATAWTPGKLSDGTVIEYTKLDTGGELTLVAADGAKGPAPVGDYELENGTVVSVTEAGKIAAVKPADASPAAESTDMATAAALRAEFTAAMATQTGVIGAQKVLIDSFVKELADLKKNTGTVLGQFKDTIEILANAETGTPADKVRNSVFSKNPEGVNSSKEKTKETFARFAESLKEKARN